MANSFLLQNIGKIREIFSKIYNWTQAEVIFILNKDFYSWKKNFIVNLLPASSEATYVQKTRSL